MGRRAEPRRLPAVYKTGDGQNFPGAFCRTSSADHVRRRRKPPGRDWHDLPLDVVGLDWRLGIDDARKQGITKTVQGNLDPSLLLAPWEVIEKKRKRYLIKA